MKIITAIFAFYESGRLGGEINSDLRGERQSKGIGEEGWSNNQLNVSLARRYQCCPEPLLEINNLRTIQFKGSVKGSPQNCSLLISTNPMAETY